MRCTINKVNGTTFYNVYIMEKKGERLEVGSSRFYPSTYRMVTVEVRKGKVVVDHNWSTTTLLPTGMSDVPAFIVEHPELREIAKEANERVQQKLIEKAMEDIAKDSVRVVTLREKGDEWQVTAKPTECWLEWALGKGFWEPDLSSCGLCPDWAASLRGEWDHAWS